MRTKEGNKEKDILSAAIIVFADEGYHKAKISKIAEVAGLAIGSIYLYFDNKEDILIKIFEKIWKQISAESQNIESREDLTPVEKLDNLIDTFFDLFTEDAHLAKVFVNEQDRLISSGISIFLEYYERFLDTGEQIVREGIKKKQFNPNIDIKILRNLIFGGIRHLLHLWANDHKAFPLNVVRQNVKFILKKGIVIP